MHHSESAHRLGIWKLRGFRGVERELEGSSEGDPTTLQLIGIVEVEPYGRAGQLLRGVQRHRRAMGRVVVSLELDV